MRWSETRRDDLASAGVPRRRDRNRCAQVRFTTDRGVSSLGRKKVAKLTSSHITAPRICDRRMIGAQALTKCTAHPPTVAMARIGPELFLSIPPVPAKTIVRGHAPHGAEQSACSWNEREQPARHSIPTGWPSWPEPSKGAVANASERNTITGGSGRSASRKHERRDERGPRPRCEGVGLDVPSIRGRPAPAQRTNHITQRGPLEEKQYTSSGVLPAADRCHKLCTHRLRPDKLKAWPRRLVPPCRLKTRESARPITHLPVW